MCSAIVLLIIGAMFWYISPAAHWLAYIFFGLAVIAFVAELVFATLPKYSSSSYYYAPSRKPGDEPPINKNVSLRAVEWAKRQREKKEQED
jgi:hypothetical protein